MTLAVKVKVFNFAKIAITSLFMIRFVSYFDKTTRSYLTYHNRLHKTPPTPHPRIPPSKKKKCFHFFFLFLKHGYKKTQKFIFIILFLKDPHPKKNKTKKTHFFSVLKDNVINDHTPTI